MKKNIMFVLLIGMFSVSSFAEGVDQKRYSIESGIIKYELTGAEEGTETVYFDRWGAREAKYTKTKMTMMGITTETNTLSILDGNLIYNIDFNEKTGTKMKGDLLSGLVNALPGNDLAEVGKNMLQGMGGIKTGEKTVAGKLCEIWEIPEVNSKAYIWESITLKSVVAMGDLTMVSTAVSIEENVKIPEGKFSIPKEIKIIDVSSESMDVGDEYKDMSSENMDMNYEDMVAIDENLEEMIDFSEKQ